MQQWVPMNGDGDRGKHWLPSRVKGGQNKLNNVLRSRPSPHPPPNYVLRHSGVPLGN